MNETLITELLTLLRREYMARHAANAREPYSHCLYELHSDRVKRIVALMADGDDEVYERFLDATFDWIDEDVTWMRRVWNELVHDVELTAAGH